MSNVIKAYTVQFNENFKMTIDSHVKFDKVIEERKKEQRLLRENKTSSFEQTNSSGEDKDGFMAGLNSIAVEASLEDIQNEKSGMIIRDAQCEANKILDQAKKEAEIIINDAYVKAKKKGYEDGMQNAVPEVQKMKAEYEERKKQLQTEYENMAAQLEPRMVTIISSLLEKMTGILVEDHDEIILYLVEKAMRNLDKCKECSIKVSREDYELIFEKKDILQRALGQEIPLFISEDENLIKNQLIVETDSKIIDCSLDIQMSNLITDLKLLGRS